MSEYKVCTKCNKELPKTLEYFYRNKQHKDGLTSSCKECKKKYRDSNKDYMKNYRKEYYKINKKEIDKKNKEWILNNKESRKNHINKWYYKNKQYYINYEKERNNKDINYKLVRLLRARIREALKNNCKVSSTLDLLGCSIDEFKKWIGITDNYDSSIFEIDHIIPCALYNMSDEEEQKKCFNYRNHRLIVSHENRIKSDKLNMNIIKKYKIENLLPKGKLNV